jgi:hypothetical protein
MLSNMEPITHRLHVFGATRSLLAGAALCYAIQDRKYIHIPIILIFPSAYTGYQVFNHKEKIVDWLLNQTVKIDYQHILK